MKVFVLNGSPRGENSVTLQTAKFFDKYFDDEFEIEHIGQKIKSYEDGAKLAPILDKMKNADLMLFSYPVYTFSVTAQLQRFLELVAQSGVDLSGKIATQFSTSKHFFDVTAHTFLKQRIFDLGMKYVSGLSADMDDLTTYEGRKIAYDFFKGVKFNVENGIFENDCNVERKIMPQYTTKLNVVSAKNQKRTVLITNAKENDESLNAMITDYVKASKTQVEVVNVNDIKFNAGCLGCLQCTQGGHCVHKDGFEELLRGTILTADATVYALKIVDHSFGTAYKTFTDRQFCNGHRTLTVGMPVGYILSGDYYGEHNVQILVEGAVAVAENVWVGTVTENLHTADDIQKLAVGIERAIETKPSPQQNFYGVGGMRIFRDMIYVMRGVMPLDHKFYREHGVYDTLPTKHKVKAQLSKLLGLLMRSGKLTTKQLNDGMLMPYNAALKKDEKFD